jgi:hypothetical protein
VFKGIDKKRHTRAPYEIHNLDGMVKKDIPMLFLTFRFLGDIQVSSIQHQASHISYLVFINVDLRYKPHTIPTMTPQELAAISIIEKTLAGTKC